MCIAADPTTGEVASVGDDFERPNGLAFSLDESHLYIADTRRNHIRVFPVNKRGRLGKGRLFAENTAGHFDGIRLDDAGRVWAGVGDGVHCFDPDGTLIGKIHLPECAANLTFGGPQRNRLFITATTSLYSIRFNVNGAPPVYSKLTSSDAVLQCDLNRLDVVDPVLDPVFIDPGATR